MNSFVRSVPHRAHCSLSWRVLGFWLINPRFDVFECLEMSAGDHLLVLDVEDHVLVTRVDGGFSPSAKHAKIEFLLM